MRPLTRRQLRNRLLMFGGLSVAFMMVVMVAEQVVPTATAPSAWTAAAVVLGGAGLASLVRWSDIGDLPQSEWQPSLLQRVLAGALAYQAGLLGYFVSGDLTAAAVGCGLFVLILGLAARLLPTLGYDTPDA